MKYILSPQKMFTTAIYCLPLVFTNLITQLTAAVSLVIPTMFSMFKASGALGGGQNGISSVVAKFGRAPWGNVVYYTSTTRSRRDIMRSYLLHSVENVTELKSRQDEMCNLPECLDRRSNIYLSSWEQRSKRKLH